MQTDVTFSTRAAASGATTTVQILSTQFSGADVEVDLIAANRFETHWLATLPITVAPNGEGSVEFQVPTVSNETVMWPAAIRFGGSVMRPATKSLLRNRRGSARRA